MMAPPPREDDGLAAIRTALSLLSVPPRGRQVRKSPLPSGVDTLIKIAVDRRAAEAVAGSLQRTPGQLMDAASFFIEQILLAPGVDSYRTLGASRESSPHFLRQNFVYLCKWVHAEEREGFAGPAYLVRITQAWNNLKTPDRRMAYDKALDASALGEPRHNELGARPARNAETSKAASFRKAASEHSRRKIIIGVHKRPSFMARLLAFAFNLKS